MSQHTNKASAQDKSFFLAGPKMYILSFTILMAGALIAHAFEAVRATPKQQETVSITTFSKEDLALLNQATEGYRVSTEARSKVIGD